MKYDVVINGKVLESPLNGIPRYAWEVLKAMDEIEDLPYKIALVVTPKVEIDYNFKQIHVVKQRTWNHNIWYTVKGFKRLAAIAWDIEVAEKLAEKNNALYLNFASKGPFYKKSISTIHDIRPITYGEGEITKSSLKFILKFFLTYKLALKNSKLLITVSEFSKEEIRKFSNYENVRVIGCGWEHMESIIPDESIFEKNPQIRKGEYYFSVSSIAPHKNFEWIVKNAAKNPQNQYVIVGRTDPNMWKEDTDDFKGNIIWLGFQSDEIVKALIKSAKALVFPSMYEGFGIPPLEALACGTPAIVADIPVMREIYGDSVSYIDPENPDSILTIQDKESIASSIEATLKTYTWKNAAYKWLDIIKEFI